MSSALDHIENLPVEEALEIMQSYMSKLSSIGMDGKSAHDISRLPDTKPRIASALLALLKVTDDPETKSNYRTGISVLAFFQPDVGENAVSLDQTGPGQQTWQDIVDEEMRILNKTLSGLGYGLKS